MILCITLYDNYNRRRPHSRSKPQESRGFDPSPDSSVRDANVPRDKKEVPEFLDLGF